MTSSPRFGLPYLQPSQAQKHITVNEALARLDAVGQMTLQSRVIAAPPLTPVEGDTYGVPAGAVNEWQGEDGRIAVFSNGGWIFLDPLTGWRAWIVDEGILGVFDGLQWAAGAVSVSPSGSALSFRSIELDHVVQAGPTSDTPALIPANSLVYGVTGLVLSDIAGAATSWRLGISGVSDNRYGSGIGLTSGSWLRGLTSSPVAYYTATALTLTGEGGDFTGGTVRLVVHLAELSLPRP